MIRMYEKLWAQLENLSKGAQAISFIGNGKFSGKTTALDAFMKASTGRVLGLTSIGIDGSWGGTESKQGSFYIREGSVIATASGLLPIGDATLEVLGLTDIHSPMGEIVILKARSAGNVVVAGPSRIKDLIWVRDAMLQAGANLVLMDGAVHRKSLALTDDEGFTVYTVSLKEMEREKLLEIIIEDLYKLQIPMAGVDLLEAAMTWDLNQDFLPSGPFLSEKMERLLSVEVKAPSVIHLKGALSSKIIQELISGLKSLKKKGQVTKIIVEDGSKIIAKAREMKVLEEMGIQFFAQKKINILAICINPFMSYLKKEEIGVLLRDIHQRIGVPVFDVKGGSFSC